LVLARQTPGASVLEKKKQLEFEEKLGKKKRTERGAKLINTVKIT